MAKKAASLIRVESFAGIDPASSMLDIDPGKCVVDNNGSRYTVGSWKPRLGMADTGATDTNSKILALGSFLSSMGQRWTLRLTADGVLAALPEVSLAWDEGDV